LQTERIQFFLNDAACVHIVHDGKVTVIFENFLSVRATRAQRIFLIFDLKKIKKLKKRERETMEKINM
jgi:hypothetical protein